MKQLHDCFLVAFIFSVSFMQNIYSKQSAAQYLKRCTNRRHVLFSHGHTSFHKNRQRLFFTNVPNQNNSTPRASSSSPKSIETITHYTRTLHETVFVDTGYIFVDSYGGDTIFRDRTNEDENFETLEKIIFGLPSSLNTKNIHDFNKTNWFSHDMKNLISTICKTPENYERVRLAYINKKIADVIPWWNITNNDLNGAFANFEQLKFSAITKLVSKIITKNFKSKKPSIFDRHINDKDAMLALYIMFRARAHYMLYHRHEDEIPNNEEFNLAKVINSAPPEEFRKACQYFVEHRLHDLIALAHGGGQCMFC